MKTASNVVPNLLYKRELIRVKNEVEVGLTISKALGLNLEYETSIYTNTLFSEEFAYVVSTGEETGSLSKSLKKIGKNYNKEVTKVYLKSIFYDGTSNYCNSMIFSRYNY
ncbi:MAG: type II secretion system F family protein [Candidatus Gracilibacteria bacterium]|nr:type II secretion system F family protein [Candidatus Gracilibacteria bacterium]